jgi:molybdate transport system substrate-binding protein
LWPKLQSKVVYATNISTAKQLAQSGNADAAFTAYSLVLHEKGTIHVVDADLHRPIDQALAMVKSSKRMASARRFSAFITGPDGRAILGRFGYLQPPS